MCINDWMCRCEESAPQPTGTQVSHQIPARGTSANTPDKDLETTRIHAEEQGLFEIVSITARQGLKTLGVILVCAFQIFKNKADENVSLDLKYA